MEQNSEPGRVRCSLAFARQLCLRRRRGSMLGGPEGGEAAGGSGGSWSGLSLEHEDFVLTPAGTLLLTQSGAKAVEEPTFWLDYAEGKRPPHVTLQQVRKQRWRASKHADCLSALRL